mmetsp:Transcript_28363/g.31863  ORF Transcript_28363/g.31863 Transcript_28363/m.31863 type:complete len:111 (+) Transcript_28363:161-493(+)
MRSTILKRKTGLVASTARMQRTTTITQLQTQTQQRRPMAGGPISGRYKVTKNKFVEEWNGKRELKEQEFVCDSKMASNLFVYLGVIPFGAYVLTRSEFQSKGDRRYKDCV